MKFEVAGVTNPQSLAEMQALLVKKAFTVSDMYILRVIRMLGHADLLSICTVLVAEREKEERKAREEKRPARCIPKLDRRSLKERLDTLAMSGLVIVEKFQINETVYAYLKSANQKHTKPGRFIRLPPMQHTLSDHAGGGSAIKI